MEDTAYRIIIMAQADQALHHIVLHVKQSFSNETAKYLYFSLRYSSPSSRFIPIIIAWEISCQCLTGSFNGQNS